MTIDQAKALLESSNVPPHSYAIRGLGMGECPGIDYKDGKWIVYYSERGEARSIVNFDSED